ncbi:MAG: hypothetical protein U9Q98_09730 [Bacteroidota bacterium]|nr:hypothetical protein [Bacteroidota bacterium]
MYHNILITFIYCAPLSAQYFELTDQTVYGGDDYDTPADIIESCDGGYYILNTSVSGINGNKTVQNYGDSDYWLIKTDSLFNDEWQLSYGGESLDEARTMLHDAAGNIYLCGYAMGTSSGNRTVDAYGQVSYWVIKLDAYGNEIWQKAYGGDVVEYLHDAVIFNNKLYLLGSSSSGVSGVKSGFNRGGADYWLVCTNTAGNMLWDKTYGGNDSDYPKTLVADSINGQIYIAGYSGSEASYEKSEDNIGNKDLWLLKVDATDGTLIRVCL